MSEAYQPLAWTNLKSEAKRIGCGYRRLYDAAASGELKAIRLNERGDWRTLPEWVDAWVVGLAEKRTRPVSVCSVV